MREKAGVEDPVCEFAREQGFFVRKCQWIGRVGAPDRLFSKPGAVPFWVEFKKPGKPLELRQEREIERMRRAGLIVYVIDNAEDGFALFG